MNVRRRKIHRKTSASAAEHLEKARDLYIMNDRTASPEPNVLLRSALVNARRCLLLDPQNYEALVLVGNIYFELDDRQSVLKALQCYEQAISIQPKYSDAYEGKSHILLHDLNRPAEAEQFARKALALALRNGEPPELLELTYINLIGLLEERKKFNEVRWLIRQALKKCPSELMKGVADHTLKRIDRASAGEQGSS